MRTILGLTLGLTLIAFATATLAQTPAHFWSQRFGSTSTDIGRAVAVDGSGNILVTGLLQNTVNFGGVDLVSAGSSDIFLAKYNASGVHQWSKRFGSTLVDIGNAVAVDASGNVVVTGYFQGTVNFGGADLVSLGVDDIFVAKYNASGVHQWSKRFGSTLTDIGNGIAVDASGNVVAAGYFQGTANFGGADLVSAGQTDIFLAKYNASGVHQWSQRFGSTNGDGANAVAVDASGNVAMTGSFIGTVDFGGGNLVSSGSDIFLAKYNASGVHQWSHSYGSPATDLGHGVDFDGSGNVVMTGYFVGTVDFGGGNLVSAGSSDLFIAKYNAAGVHVWSKRSGGTGGEAGNALDVDGAGNVVVTGNFQNTVDFGGGNRVSVGGSDAFLAKYDASGAHQWSRGFGSTSNDDANGVAVDGSGNVVMTGQYVLTADFGGGGLVSAGGNEIFLAKYASLAQEPVITSITDIGNDQGRQVKIRFAGSGFDGDLSPTTIVQYVAFRRDDAPPSSSTLEGDRANLSERQLLDLGWTQAGVVAAFEQSSYGMDVATIGDSTETGPYYSTFFVRAATVAPGTYFDSPIDSGYSIDNLAPGVPAAFAFQAGVLSWNESSSADFDFFSVYGSATSSFGSATLVDYTTATSLDVTGAGYVYYFVTATDFSGNEGNPAAINSLTGVGGTPKSHVLSISAYPNPFNPATTLRYTVPAKGRVTIEVFDARGARVATLVERDMDAGAHTVGWDGRDSHGSPVGSGVYFARLTSAAGTRSYKLTLLK